jgi:hypothetical protein
MMSIFVPFCLAEIQYLNNKRWQLIHMSQCRIQVSIEVIRMRASYLVVAMPLDIAAVGFCWRLMAVAHRDLAHGFCGPGSGHRSDFSARAFGIARGGTKTGN